MTLTCIIKYTGFIFGTNWKKVNRKVMVDRDIPRNMLTMRRVKKAVVVLLNAFNVMYMNGSTAQL